MTLLHTIMLLAACSTAATGGPVPKDNRRQLITSYANTTSVTPFISNMVKPSASAVINADTALVIEPLQRTVITQVRSAVTFLNPEGKPLATQDAETVLLTSYFTPTPASALPSSVAAASSIGASSSPTASSWASSSKSNSPLAVRSSPAVASASSQAVIASQSLSSPSIPSFTYAPEESQAHLGTSIVSPTPIVTSKSATGNSTGLPGFNHPGPALQSPQPTSMLSSSAVVKSSAMSQSTVQPSSVLPSSSPLPASNFTQPPLNSGRSTAFVIKTEYTTVYPTSAAVLPSSVAPQPLLPSPSQGSELAAGSTLVQSQPPIASPTSSPPVQLSPTPLAPPPVIIITQYTTVAQSSLATPSPPPQPSNSPVAPVPEPAPVSSVPAAPSSVVKPSTSAAVPTLPSLPPAPTLSSAAQSTPSPSQAPLASTQSSSSAAPSTSPPTTPGTQPPAIPSSAAPPLAPSTSDGPLVITPIAPSQLFTVTVTTTEKETVTEKATVSVTVRA